jgi:ribonuclease P protein subunit POP4
MESATLAGHELAGLTVEVVASSNPDLVGVEGEVVDETTNTLLVAGEGRVKQVPKAAATFEFRLPDGDDDGGSEDGTDDVSSVTVDGERLVARPARRTEHTGANTWR